MNPSHFAYASTLLSFDDGPGPSTPALLDVLRQAKCVATFFVLGKNLKQAPELALRLLKEGHVLGNHTWSHARPGVLSPVELIQEIEATDVLIQGIRHQAGLPESAAIPLRLPYGLIHQDPRLSALAQLGRSHTGWTAIVDDWQRPVPSAVSLCQAMRMHIDTQNALGQVARLCLHDSSRHGEARPETVEAVRLLLLA